MLASHQFAALGFLAIVLGALPRAEAADTHTAAALTPEAVWDAIQAARDGDTVLLPAGTAVWRKGGIQATGPR